MRPRSWLAAVAGVALVSIGAGTFLVGAAEKARAQVVGNNFPVDAGARDPKDIRAHNSPTLAANPRNPANLAVANRVDSPRFSCVLHVSGDAGQTWTETPIPFPTGEEAPPRCFAPDVAFGADGTIYLSFVTLKGIGNVPNAGWVASSSDGGRSLSAPKRALGSLAFQLRLAADPRTPGRIYLSWLQAEEVATLAFPRPGNPIRTVRSDDGGATWGRAVSVNTPVRTRVVAPAPAIGPNGEVYVAYLDLGDDALDYQGAHEGKGGDPYPGRWSLLVARSTDAGATWAEAAVDQELVPFERIVVFFPPSPSLAVDQASGRVYVAFHDARLGDADVWVWASDDGMRYSAPTRVNDTKPRDGTAQYLPKLAVAPNGRLDVVYYDRRASADNVMNEVSLQWSKDQGRSFEPRVRLSDRSFDARVGFGSERGLPDLGSRLGMVSSEARALAVWTDTRSGTEASNKQDLARAVVAFSRASSRQWLRLLGLALGALGLATLGWWAAPLLSRRHS